MNFLKKNLAVTILALLLIFCASFWLYWHLKPFTANAFVFADTRPVSPWTAGYITRIFVKNNQFVKKGTPLFSVFAPPYELKVRELAHEKEKLTERLKSCEAQWRQALEEIKSFQADVENFQYLFSRAEKMFKTAAVSEDYLVSQKRNLTVSLARKAAAEHHARALKHDCAALQQQIIKTAAALELAQI